MSKRKKMQVFIAGPFSSTRRHDRSVSSEVQLAVESVLKEVKALGFEAFSSHLEEDYGRMDLAPRYLASRDIVALKEATIFVYLSWVRFPSVGSMIELGIALEREIRCIWLDVDDKSESGGEYLAGLVDLGRVERSPVCGDVGLAVRTLLEEESNIDGKH